MCINVYIIKCAEFQIIWMKVIIHLPGGTAVEFHLLGTNGLKAADRANWLKKWIIVDSL